MTKSSSRVAASQKRSTASSPRLWWFLILGGGAVVTVVVVLILLSPPAPAGMLDGMLSFNNLSRNHSEAPQQYAQTPPAGGVHSAVWQNCGIYDQPVRNENAVHSLEHGAVWLAYRPDLPAAAVETLRNLARGHGHVLLAPYPDLPHAVVATAWGLQLAGRRCVRPASARICLALRKRAANAGARRNLHRRHRHAHRQLTDCSRESSMSREAPYAARLSHFVEQHTRQHFAARRQHESRQPHQPR